MNSVNLIPAPRRAARARRVRLWKWAVALGTYAAALTAGFGICGRYGSADNAALAGQDRHLTAQLSVWNRAILKTNAELFQVRQELQAAHAVSQQPDWGVLLALVSKNLGDTLVLDGCTFAVNSATDKPAKPPAPGEPAATPTRVEGQVYLELSGLARSQSDVSAFMLRLEKTGVFDKVKLVKTNSQPFLDEKAVAFRVECVLMEGGGTSR